MNVLVRTKYALGTAVGRPRRERFLRALPQHGVGVELGVFRGGFTAKLLRWARPRELHLVDGWWEIYGECFPNWGAYSDFGRLSTRAAYEEARDAVKRFDARCTFHIGDDLEVLHTFPDDFFDWVYIDTTHEYGHTRDELEILRRKVKPSGVIAGDDWHEDPAHLHHGVCRAVREFCDRYGWELRNVDSFGQWLVAPADAAG